ncbi:hypothetical protein HanIR_Chr10g0495861 [Helianthus annuus]|nr:hypothetical protein HanIR_Chr10g0495861 [Helianthus annuus]
MSPHPWCPGLTASVWVVAPRGAIGGEVAGVAPTIPSSLRNLLVSVMLFVIFFLSRSLVLWTSNEFSYGSSWSSPWTIVSSIILHRLFCLRCSYLLC